MNRTVPTRFSTSTVSPTASSEALSPNFLRGTILSLVGSLSPNAFAGGSSIALFSIIRPPDLHCREAKRCAHLPSGWLFRRLVNTRQRLLDRTDRRIDELPRHQPHATHPEHLPLGGTEPSSHEDTMLFAELLPEERVIDAGGIPNPHDGPPPHLCRREELEPKLPQTGVHS